MSDNRHPLPPFEPGTFRAADGTIRRFSDYRSRPYDRPADSASGSLYTVVRQFHNDLDRLGRHLLVTTNDPNPGTSRMASNSDRWRQRFINDAQTPNPNDTLSNPPPLPPLRSLGTRARAPVTPSDPPTSRSSRYRPANRRPYIDNSAINTSPDELNRNIDDTNTPLRALLNFTGYSSSMPRAPPAVPHGHEAAEESRRVKRRKLDSDRIAPSFKGFRYGKYGQVDPGQLTMEIVSCDGGLYSDEHFYAPENILRDDNSVYCTKGNRCNIVLKHQGGTIFTLSELVVKAPGSRFSCPVREGMVFVATESDELLTRTAQYQIQYQPGRSSQRTRGTVVFRHDDDGTGFNRWQTRYLRAYSYGADDDGDDDEEEHDDDEDCRTAQIPPEFTVAPGRFDATTEMSENDSDDENIMVVRDRMRRQQQQQQQQQGTQTPNRIGLLAFESGTSDDDDGGGGGGDQDNDNDEVGVTMYRTMPSSRSEDSLVDAAAAAASISARRQRQRQLRRSAIANARIRDEIVNSTVHPRAGTSTNTNTNTNPSTNPSTNTNTGAGSGPAMTLEQAQEASQIATQEAVRAVGGGLMAPLAHFFIEKDKNKCIIRFDPPVSARYLLLKMWSPHHDLHDGPKNIDIQAVTVKGFAGPRFCPAVEMA